MLSGMATCPIFQNRAAHNEPPLGQGRGGSQNVSYTTDDFMALFLPMLKKRKEMHVEMLLKVNTCLKHHKWYIQISK